MFLSEPTWTGHDSAFITTESRKSVAETGDSATSFTPVWTYEDELAGGEGILGELSDLMNICTEKMEMFLGNIWPLFHSPRRAMRFQIQGEHLSPEVRALIKAKTTLCSIT